MFALDSSSEEQGIWSYDASTDSEQEPTSNSHAFGTINAHAARKLSAESGLSSGVCRALSGSLAHSPQKAQSIDWEKRVLNHLARADYSDDDSDETEVTLAGRSMLICSNGEAGKGCYKAHIVACEVLLPGRDGDKVDVRWKAVARYPQNEGGQRECERDVELIQYLAKRNISHPNLLHHEVRELGGAMVLCAELAEMDLAEALCSRNLSLAARINILIGCMRPIVYWHRLGIVHGDLKPDNILLCTRGLSRNVRTCSVAVADVRVGDFGTLIRAGVDKLVYGAQEQVFVAPEKRANLRDLLILRGRRGYVGLLEWMRRELSRLQGQENNSGSEESSEQPVGWYEIQVDETEDRMRELGNLVNAYRIVGDNVLAERLEKAYFTVQKTRASVESIAQTELEVLKDSARLSELLQRLEFCAKELAKECSLKELAAADAYSLGVLAGVVLGTGIPAGSLTLARSEHERRCAAGSLRPLDRVMSACSALEQSHPRGELSRRTHALVTGLCHPNPMRRMSIGQALFELICLRVALKSDRERISK